MTQKELDALTEQERKAFEDKCKSFDEEQSIKEYTADIRDIIYLWRHVREGRKAYTLDAVSKTVETEAAQIKRLYDAKEPAAYAAIDVDYCCG